MAVVCAFLQWPIEFDEERLISDAHNILLTLQYLLTSSHCSCVARVLALASFMHAVNKFVSFYFLSFLFLHFDTCIYSRTSNQ